MVQADTQLTYHRTWETGVKADNEGHLALAPHLFSGNQLSTSFPSTTLPELTSNYSPVSCCVEPRPRAEVFQKVTS